jgi:hypothetical protein
VRLLRNYRVFVAYSTQTFKPLIKATPQRERPMKRWFVIPVFTP